MKTVLVTGCSSGIGKCIALGLKNRGYRVFASVRKPEQLESLNHYGLEVLLIDLNDSNSIQTAAAELIEKTEGQIHGLVNNAAYGLSGAIEDLTGEGLREQFQTNVLGTQELTNLLIPAMRKNKQGRIIQISSMLGFITLRFRGAYCASKYALESLSDAMRYELNNTGIHVSLIEPGPIRSEFRTNSLGHYKNTVDKENSPHKNAYAKIEKEMNADDYTIPFTLGPEAVLKRVIHALESDNPKARYYVTFPAYLFAFLKRILPAMLLDKILVRI